MKLQISFDRIGNPSDSYAEINQSRPCLFAFAEEENETIYPLHKLVKCRDFLNDTLVWQDEKATGQIWGYSYSGGYDRDCTHLLMSASLHLVRNIGLFNTFEVSLGLSPTELRETTTDDSFAVRGDKWWQTTTLHSSWYTQVLRHLTCDIKSLKDESTEKMVNELKETFWKIPSWLQKLKTSQVRNAPSLSSMHDHNGFYTQFGPAGNYMGDKLFYNAQLKEIRNAN